MKYRAVASALVLVIVLGLYVFAKKDGSTEAASSAPPAAAQTDDSSFKGLGK